MAKFVWQDGTLVSKAKVEVGGTIYEVDPEEYSGTTPLSASNLNAMVDNIYDDMTKSEVYSTEETVIGTYLNKPLYRKVLTGTLPTGSGENTFNFSGISIINFYGKIKATSGASFLINTYYTPLPAYSISGWVDSSGNLKIECGTNYRTTSEYEITIEYTKN